MHVVEELNCASEQVASMTKRSADHARRADSMVQDTSRVVREVDVAMSDLRHSMNEI